MKENRTTSQRISSVAWSCLLIVASVFLSHSMYGSSEVWSRASAMSSQERSSGYYASATGDLTEGLTSEVLCMLGIAPVESSVEEEEENEPVIGDMPHHDRVCAAISLWNECHVFCTCGPKGSTVSNSLYLLFRSWKSDLI